MKFYILKAQKSVRPNQKALQKIVRNFRKGESGGLVIFGLFLFVSMLMIGGLAVDFMRYETDRTHLQNTVDRAVLAAASIDQELDPAEVVNDYFTKAGIPEALMSVSVTSENGARKVTADAQLSTNPMFLGLLGIEDLVAPASGTAEQSVGNVEISLVLDVSGSMNGSKLTNLKTAAKDFIDSFFDSDTASDGYSMSIIPFAGQVNAGANFLSKFDVDLKHNYSNCIDFTEAQFDTSALSTDEVLAHAGHFDPYGLSKISSSSSIFCPTENSRAILPVSNDAATLRDYIDDLTAHGSTAAEIGIKWGTALLDPSTQPAIDDLIVDFQVDPSLSGRPFEYDDESRPLKVLVVMTDGLNTGGYSLKPGYDSGLSDIWYDSSSDSYSVYDASRNLYYRTNSASYNITGPWAYTPAGGSNAVRLTYPELWSQVSVGWNAAYNYYAQDRDYSTYWSWRDRVLQYTIGTIKDQLMESICTAAKDQEIVIYTIGFQVSDSTAAKLENCATSPAHFFRIENLNISDAFTAISRQISKLRLTQ